MSVRHNIRHAAAFWDEHVGDDDGTVPRGAPTPDPYTMGRKPGFKKVAACGCGWRTEAGSWDEIAEQVGFHTTASRADGGPETAQAAHDEARRQLYAAEQTGQEA